MAVERYADRDRERLRRAGRAAAEVLDAVGARVRGGVRTADIDDWVREEVQRRGIRSSQLGYRGFPASVCTSVNAVVCHGIPSTQVRLTEGDIVNVDVTVEVDGMHGDTSRTFLVGQVDESSARLVAATKAAMWAGVRAVGPQARLGDVGAAILEVAERAGFSVVRSYCGHGIGRRMHMPPSVPHFGVKGRGLRLRPGMAFTIEPMLNAGSELVVEEADGWTVRTADGERSAQFEHTVLVTETGVEVLTALEARSSSH